MKTSFHLPTTLSKLLLTAVTDVLALQKDPQYVLDGLVWHQRKTRFGRTTRKCHACLAGAVLRARAKPGAADRVAPSMMSPAVYKKLLAIDAMRTGRMYGATEHLADFPDPDHRQLRTLERVGLEVARAFDEKTGLAPLDVYRNAALSLASVGL